MKLSPFSQLVAWCLALALPPSSLATPDWISYPLSIVSQFETPTTFENIAVRSNGELLLTSTASPYLFQVSPLFENRYVPVAQIPYVRSLLGIAELEENIFYVIGANMTGLTTDPGTNSVWRVDLRSVSKNSISNETSPMAEVTLVAALEKAGTLNGICQLGQSDHMLIMADSADGTIWNLDVNTGSHEIVINQPILKYTSQGLQFGVDGVHTHDSDLFFTNYNQGLLVKIPVSTIWGNATGPAELIVNGIAGDDFVLSPDGTKAWIALNNNGTIVEVNILKKSSRVIAESSALLKAAAVTIGRTKWDRNSLYVASGRMVNTRGNGTRSEGIVARIDLPNAISF